MSATRRRLSNHDSRQLQAAEQLGHVDSLQPPFSMIHRGLAGATEAAAEQHTGVLVYSPMQSGLLTRSMSYERLERMPHDDWRRGHEDFTGENLSRNLALPDRRASSAERLEVAPGALAVAWALARPGVTAAIVERAAPSRSPAGCRRLVGDLGRRAERAEPRDPRDGRRGGGRGCTSEASVRVTCG